MKFITFAVVALMVLAAPTAADVNVYSAREEALIKPILDRFTATTGIETHLVTGSADALLKRLEVEGVNSPADLFITVDAGRLHRAKQAGVLRAVDSADLDAALPAHLRDPEGYWFGLSLRARPIFYVKARVDPSELSTYEALTDSKWKGRICVRSSDNIYNQSLVASMIATHGEAETEAWLRGFVANLARSPRGGDRDQIKAAAAGECDLAIANTYYFARMLTSTDERERETAGKLAVFWPNQAGRGVHVNVSGAGVTQSAANADQAIELLRYLLADDAQRWYALVNEEYPVRSGLPSSPTVTGLGEFKADTLSLSVLGKLNATAVMLMDRAGWN